MPKEVQIDSLSILKVERRRLRALQNEDEECAVVISLLENGSSRARRLFDRASVEQVERELPLYCIKDGLLSRRVNLPSGETVVPVIPKGGKKAVVTGGKKRVLSWRKWILHYLHCSTAGGHVSMPHLQQRVQEVAWWGKIGTDCIEWVRSCPICKMVKGQPHGSAAWRSERYTSPFRVLQIDLMGPYEPHCEGNSMVLSVIDMFSLWLWLVPIVDKEGETVAEAL